MLRFRRILSIHSLRLRVFAHRRTTPLNSSKVPPLSLAGRALTSGLRRTGSTCPPESEASTSASSCFVSAFNLPFLFVLGPLPRPIPFIIHDVQPSLHSIIAPGYFQCSGRSFTLPSVISFILLARGLITNWPFTMVFILRAQTFCSHVRSPPNLAKKGSILERSHSTSLAYTTPPF